MRRSSIANSRRSPSMISKASRAPSPKPGTTRATESPGPGGRVADPSAIGLRNDDVAGELLLVLRQRPDTSAKDVAQAHLLQVVVAQSAAAVQVHHERERAGRLRPEHTIRHHPVTLVGARLEACFDPFGSLPERCRSGPAAPGTVGRLARGKESNRLAAPEGPMRARTMRYHHSLPPTLFRPTWNRAGRSLLSASSLESGSLWVREVGRMGSESLSRRTIAHKGVGAGFFGRRSLENPGEHRLT